MMRFTSGFAFAAIPTSRGAAPRWSKPGSAKPLCEATVGGISLKRLETFATFSRKPMPTSESSVQPLAFGTSPHAQYVFQPRSLSRYFSARSCRSEEHTSELQSRQYLVCRLLLEKKKKTNYLSVIDTVDKC